MKLYITGCARSGTTVMLYLMRYFYNTDVVLEREVSPGELMNTEHFGKIFVFKKPQLKIEDRDFVPLKYTLDNGFHVLFMVRDPRDILVSTHCEQAYYVHPERLCETYLELLACMRYRNLHIVRYEDLVYDSKTVMDSISGFINGDYQDDYTQFYESMEEPQMIAGIEPRPLSGSSIGNWKDPKHNEYIKAVFDSGYGHILNRLIDILGY